jgi:ferric-dicitrate binding protein FerR (iron transport regulator)
MDGAVRQLQGHLEVIIDGTASDEERREFAMLVEQHPDLTAPLVEQLRTHSLLQWQCHEIDLHLPELAHNALSGSNPKRRTRRIVGWIASIAAAVALAGTTVFWSSNELAPGDLTVAEVVDDGDVVWSENTTAVKQDRSIHPGIVEIESGSLTLRFRSGATVVFRGAASMRIESDMLVRLDRGQATAQVPHWATGFTIETADVEVIDLGTQFGVSAHDDGTTDVVIFEGKVDVKPTGGSKQVLKRLNQGEAARINSSGAIKRIVEVRGDIKDGWTTSNHPASSENVFKAIRDNIPPSDGSKYFYYQLSTAGLEEDSWAYVDRHPHQWNGLTPAGLPKFLLGAEYARTFNDYRYIQGFEIVVELARPADLYVFFDDRVPTPDWLLERFEDTGINIGLDEGPWEGIPDHRTAIGAGNSIDNVFSVWRRRCTRPEEVTLGAVGESIEARAMYGIAATPLEPEPANTVSN